MMQKLVFNRFFFVSMMMLIIVSGIVFSQNAGATFNKTAEYDIGFKCPEASTLDPSGTQIWLLMDDCRGWNYTLAVYNIADGSLVDMPDYATELEPLNLYDADEIIMRIVYAPTNPIAFTPEGDLSIHYASNNFDEDTVATYTLIIPVATGGDATLQENTTLDEVLLQYSEYLDSAVFNHDHTQLAIWDDSSVHIIDIATENEIAEIEAEGDIDTTILSFGDDNSTLRVIHIDSPDPSQDPTASLSIFSLPDGDLLNQYDLPSYSAWVNADTSFAALTVFDDVGTDKGLVIMDLTTGDMSQMLDMNEAPVSVTKCLNTGQSTTDYNYVSKGKFWSPELHWLADNSTLVGGFSFGGDGFNDCYFDYSRLRIFSVNSN